MKIRPKDISRTLLACPSSWEGMLPSGHTFYARYRGGRLRVVFSAEPFMDACVNWLDGFVTPVVDEQLGNDFDGWLTTGDFILRLKANNLLECSCLYLWWVKIRVVVERLHFNFLRRHYAKKIRKSIYGK